MKRHFDAARTTASADADPRDNCSECDGTLNDCPNCAELVERAAGSASTGDWPTREEAEKRAAELMAIGRETLAKAGLCTVCGEPMPKGEEMFNYHGFSGPCPTAAQQNPCTYCGGTGRIAQWSGREPEGPPVDCPKCVGGDLGENKP